MHAGNLEFCAGPNGSSRLKCSEKKFNAKTPGRGDAKAEGCGERENGESSSFPLFLLFQLCVLASLRLCVKSLFALNCSWRLRLVEFNWAGRLQLTGWIAIGFVF
jgi:hypothetical protein